MEIGFCLQDLAILRDCLSSFRIRNDVIILVAEDSRASMKSSKDWVTSSIISPPFRMSANHHSSLIPTYFLLLEVEQSVVAFLFR